jgi:predicted double-glycine peptidase
MVVILSSGAAALTCRQTPSKHTGRPADLEDNTVTLRDRDTMQQIRVSIDELERIIEERVRF